MTVVKKDPLVELDFMKFNPKDYLAEFYSGKPEEDFGENFSLAWFAAMYDKLQPTGKLLEYGIGGAIYSLITASKYVSEIHIGDLVPACLQEVKDWQMNKGHDWNHYFRRAIELETMKPDVSIDKRTEFLKEKITNSIILDERVPPDLKYSESYDVLGLHFVSESTTHNYKEFEEYTANAISYLKKGGILMMSCLKESSEYKVGNKWFPAVPITELFLEKTFIKLGVNIVQLVSVNTYDSKRRIQGYIFAGGVKQ